MQFPSSPKAEDLKVEATEVDGQASLLLESLLVEGGKGGGGWRVRSGWRVRRGSRYPLPLASH